MDTWFISIKVKLLKKRTFKKFLGQYALYLCVFKKMCVCGGLLSQISLLVLSQQEVP